MFRQIKFVVNWVFALLQLIAYANADRWKSDEFPDMHLVSIRYYHMLDYQLCVGTILTERYILVSATCTVEPIYKNQLLEANTLYVERSAMDPVNRQSLIVDKVERHPSYGLNSFSHDIAYLHINQNIKALSQNLFPILVAESFINNVSLAGQHCIALGELGRWNQFAVIEVKIMPESDCINNYSRTYGDNIICATKTSSIHINKQHYFRPDGPLLCGTCLVGLTVAVSKYNEPILIFTKVIKYKNWLPTWVNYAQCNTNLTKIISRIKRTTKSPTATIKTTKLLLTTTTTTTTTTTHSTSSECVPKDRDNNETIVDYINFPNKHLVSIRYGPYERYFGDNHICPGAIVSPNIIATPAHCVDINPFTFARLHHKEITVAVGLSLDKNNEQPTFFDVGEIITHPRFDDRNYRNDIALLVLQESIVLEGGIVEVIQIADRTPREGTNCTAIGREESVHVISHAMEIANVSVWPKLKCLNSFVKVLGESILCADDKYKTKMYPDEAEMAYFDSGGPLFCNGKLAGLTVFQEGGGEFGFPNVFVDVSKYKEWMDTTIKRHVLKAVSYQGRSARQRDGTAKASSAQIIQKHTSCKLIWLTVTMILYHFVYDQ